MLTTALAAWLTGVALLALAVWRSIATALRRAAATEDEPGPAKYRYDADEDWNGEDLE